jgi:hypothetical protein
MSMVIFDGSEGDKYDGTKAKTSHRRSGTFRIDRDCGRESVPHGEPASDSVREIVSALPEILASRNPRMAGQPE